MACRVVPNFFAEAAHELAEELDEVAVDPIIAKQAQAWNSLRNQIVGHEKSS